MQIEKNLQSLHRSDPMWSSQAFDRLQWLIPQRRYGSITYQERNDKQSERIHWNSRSLAQNFGTGGFSLSKLPVHCLGTIGGSD